MRFCAQRSELSALLQDIDGLKASPEDGLWVWRPAYSSGGVQAELLDNRAAVGEEHDGQLLPYTPACSVSQLFVASGGRSCTVGFSTQWQSCHNPQRPFCFGGAVNCSDLDASACDLAQRCADCLARALSLRGLNNIDYLWDGRDLYFLELNPRPSSTMQLYEDVFEQGLFAVHWQACCAESASFVDGLRPAKPRLVRAYMPVYMRSSCRIPAGFDRWPDDTADRPDTRCGALRVEAGWPLCTVTADGASSAEVLTLLQQRMRQVFETLECTGALNQSQAHVGFEQPQANESQG